MDKWQASREAEELSFRGTYAGLQEEMDRLRQDVLLAVRELSGDMMRSSQGEPLEFVHRYADRYDTAAYRAVEQERRSRGTASSSPALPEGHEEERHEATEKAMAAEDHHSPSSPGDEPVPPVRFQSNEPPSSSPSKPSSKQPEHAYAGDARPKSDFEPAPLTP